MGHLELTDREAKQSFYPTSKQTSKQDKGNLAPRHPAEPGGG